MTQGLRKGALLGEHKVYLRIVNLVKCHGAYLHGVTREKVDLYI